MRQPYFLKVIISQFRLYYVIESLFQTPTVHPNPGMCVRPKFMTQGKLHNLFIAVLSWVNPPAQQKHCFCIIIINCYYQLFLTQGMRRVSCLWTWILLPQFLECWDLQAWVIMPRKSFKVINVLLHVFVQACTARWEYSLHPRHRHLQLQPGPFKWLSFNLLYGLKDSTGYICPISLIYSLSSVGFIAQSLWTVLQ